MIVQSFLKSGDGLIPVEEFTGPVRDEDYVEGSIEIIVDDKTLMGRDVVDLVDQLWAYFINGVLQVARGEAFKTMLPDCAIRVAFRPDPDGRRVTIAVTNQDVAPDQEASVDTDRFIEQMAAEARHCLGALARLIPGRREGYEYLLQKLADGLGTHERRTPMFANAKKDKTQQQPAGPEAAPPAPEGAQAGAPAPTTPAGAAPAQAGPGAAGPSQAGDAAAMGGVFGHFAEGPEKKKRDG